MTFQMKPLSMIHLKYQVLFSLKITLECPLLQFFFQIFACWVILHAFLSSVDFF